jgi:two-component sensor histidine kinase
VSFIAEPNLAPVRPSTFEPEMNHRAKFILTHAAVVLLFLAIPYLITPREWFRLPNLSGNPRDRAELLSYTLMIGFFYVNYYRLMPGLFIRKKYATFAIVTISISAVILWYPFLFELVRPPHHFPPGKGLGGPPPPNPGLHVKHNAALFILGWLLSVARFVFDRHMKMETERAKSEAAFLRTQMNPHFMFNSLNSIYGLALSEKAMKTSRAIVTLSDLTRHLLTESPKERSTLGKETEHLTNYVELQKLRLPAESEVRLSIESLNSDLEIPPMLMLPLAENAFKHGVLKDGKVKVEMTLTEKNGVLEFCVSNLKGMLSPADGNPSGFGLDVTRKRLELEFPGRHALTTEAEGDRFVVTLKITLS